MAKSHTRRRQRRRHLYIKIDGKDPNIKGLKLGQRIKVECYTHRLLKLGVVYI